MLTYPSKVLGKIGVRQKNTEKYMSPFCRMLIQLEDIKAETGIDTFNIEQDFSFREGLYPTLTKPEYWSRLGSSKNRTNDQKDESQNLINDILEACSPDNLIALSSKSWTVQGWSMCLPPF